MKYSELLDIIKTGEGYTIEFKESMNSSIGKEICAFANSSGGKIIIGVEDKTSKVIGYKLTNSDRSKIQDIARNMNPPFFIQIEQTKNLTEENDSKVKFEVESFFNVNFHRKIRCKSETNRTQIGRKSDKQTREKWIMNYLKENKIIKTVDIMKQFSVAKGTASRDLKSLIKQNKIVRKGRGNNVWYVLKNEEGDNDN